MSRFYYYLVYLNMVVNIVASVPSIFLHYSREGALLGILLSVFFGALIIWVYTRFFNAFPGKGLPELLKLVMPNWFTKAALLYFSAVWFIAGLITLVTFSFLLLRFLVPDMPLLLVVINLVLFLCFGILIQTDRLLYSVEIVIVLFFPLILFILAKAGTTEKLRWDYVRIAVTYINQTPNFESFAAASFLFLGVANLVIFNRFFTTKQQFGLKQLFTVVIVGLIALLVTYFIPIGFHGLKGAESLVYPWIATSDALRMEYGVIERVVFIFLLFYFAISFISISIHWHVSFQLLKSTFDFGRFRIKSIPVMPFLITLLFGVLSAYATLRLTEHQLFIYTSFYYKLLTFSFVGTFALFWWMKRRLKHEKNSSG